MHRKNSDTGLGTIKIHKNVIASIASIAAKEIDGVKEVKRSLKSSILELFGIKGFAAIKVEIDKNEEISAEIPVIIKYGFNIPEVAASIQDNVHRLLEKMTGSVIKNINVNVQGVEKGEGR